MTILAPSILEVSLRYRHLFCAHMASNAKSSTRIGRRDIKTDYLACPTRVGGPKLALRRLIRDLRHHTPCAYPFLGPKILSKFEKWENKVPKIRQ